MVTLYCHVFRIRDHTLGDNLMPLQTCEPKLFLTSALEAPLAVALSTSTT